MILGSLTTCDPGDIFETVAQCKNLKLRTSIIGLAAEVHVCKHICEETEGVYSVILDEMHLLDLLQKIAFPLPNSVNTITLIIFFGSSVFGTTPSYYLNLSCKK